MKYELVTAPATEFVTAAMVENMLGLASGFDAAKISRDISAARYRAETYCQRAFINQTWKLVLDKFPDMTDLNKKQAIYLPMGKVQSITSFTYIDSDNATITMVVDTDYYLDSIGSTARLLPVGVWPGVNSNRPNTIEINYVVGYGTTLPAQYSSVIDAVLLDACDLYEQRQIQTEAVKGGLYMNEAYKAILDQYLIYFDPRLND